MVWSRRTWWIFSAAEVMNSATSPSGMLMKKIHCHPGPSANQPPSTGPSTEEVPNTAAK